MSIGAGVALYRERAMGDKKEKGGHLLVISLYIHVETLRVQTTRRGFDGCRQHERERENQSPSPEIARETPWHGAMPSKETFGG